MTPEPTIRPLRAVDWPAVREIYRAGIESGDATFETVVPEWPVSASRRSAPYRSGGCPPASAR